MKTASLHLYPPGVCDNDVAQSLLYTAPGQSITK